MPLPGAGEADAIYGSGAPSGGLPSPDEADALYYGKGGAQALPPPMAGAAHDTLFGSAMTAGGRILGAMGYGAAAKWGAKPSELDPEVDGIMSSLGLSGDYSKTNNRFFKSVSEAVLRPVISAADYGVRDVMSVIPSALGALSSGLTQTGMEVAGGGGNVAQGDTVAPNAPGNVREALAYSLFAYGETAEGYSEGLMLPEVGFGIGREGAMEGAARVGRVAEDISDDGGGGGSPASPETDALSDTLKARSAGVVGEGEAGYYDANPLTPEKSK